MENKEQKNRKEEGKLGNKIAIELMEIADQLDGLGFIAEASSIDFVLSDVMVKLSDK